MGQIVQTEMTVLVTPDMANFSGNMHGGELLKLLDKVAYTCAMRYSGHYAVTLSVDNVLFKEPIHIGELVTCLATINYTGNTSMEIGIKVVAEDIRPAHGTPYAHLLFHHGGHGRKQQTHAGTRPAIKKHGSDPALEQSPETPGSAEKTCRP